MGGGVKALAEFGLHEKYTKNQINFDISSQGVYAQFEKGC